jgi:hypothetical protein
MLGPTEIDEIVVDACESGDFTDALCMVAEYENVLGPEKERLLRYIEARRAESSNPPIADGDELSLEEIMALNTATLDGRTSW